MTVERRAKTTCDAFITDGYLKAIERSLRDQIEECATLIDMKARDYEHSLKTIKHFTGTYQEVELMQELAAAIRALAK